MNNTEAKFFLSAYRPDGRDAGELIFVGALAQASRDPELRDWFERQRTFDAACSAKLREIAPPAGLREAILAGGRASQPQRRWWRNPAWLAAAAAVAISVGSIISVRPAGARPTGAQLADFALRDLAEAHGDHVGHPPMLAAVQARLADTRLPVTRHLALNLDELRKDHCRVVRVAGRDVFELCFQREGTWYHVYVGRRLDFAPGALDPKTLLVSHGQFAATAWADADLVYALVTRAGPEALQRVI